MSACDESCKGPTAGAVVSYLQSAVLPGCVADLGGFVGQRWRANRSGSIDRFDIDLYVKMLETPQHKDWWWIGEQPGKWLESAILTALTDPGHSALLPAARTIAARIITAQLPDGYLGITHPSLRSPAKPLRGMDPYEQYFTLHALLTAFEALGDHDAIAAAIKLADYYLQHIGPGKAEFWPSPIQSPENRQLIICKQWTWVPDGTRHAPRLHWHSDIAGHTAHYGWEGTLIIEPILRLYELTGERRFLHFAQWVVSRIDLWSGWDAFSRLDDVAAGDIGIHQLQPYVHAHTFHMNFLAFLRLYRISGDESLLRKVRGAWNDIAKRQMYITGGVSAGEHYKPLHDRPLNGDVVETCANMSWMQLTQELLQLTGEVVFADVIERLLLNHVLASQTVDGDSYRYHTPPNGQKPTRYFHGPDCCTSSGTRLMSMLPLFLYSVAPGTVIVNQYVPSALTIKLPEGPELTITQTSHYPQSEEVTITLATPVSAEFSLKLRIPGWCDAATVAVNGADPTPGQPGSYLEVRRKWTSGDRLLLRLPMITRWIEHSPQLPGLPLVALTRGPVIYAIDTLWWQDPVSPPPMKVDEAVSVLFPATTPLETVDLPEGNLGPGFRAPVTLANGSTATATFVPFANVGRWYLDDQPRPDPESSAYSYAVWLNAITS